MGATRADSGSVGSDLKQAPSTPAEWQLVQQANEDQCRQYFEIINVIEY